MWVASRRLPQFTAQAGSRRVDCELRADVHKPLIVCRLHGSRYVDALPDVDQQLENSIVSPSDSSFELPCL